MLKQSVTVINKSGKVVSTSKQLVSVWKEAKAAYKARKEELKATRQSDYREREVRKALEHATLSEEHVPRRSRDDQHHSSSRSHVSRSKTTSRRKEGRRPTLERGATDAGYLNEVAYSHPSELPAYSAQNRGLVRRSTEPIPRARSDDSYDSDLAYGSLPPPLPVQPTQDVGELREKMSKVNQLLNEAHCLQYSATAVIEHLQKNPDALAAVGLALGEVATLVKTLGPGALASMKVAFPAVVALLASPQFLIAGGLAVGVTVIMLGGYKIVKKIRENQSAQEDDEVMELRELEGDLSRIEGWRRGVADAGYGTDYGTDNGTSVEGEFVTPGAERILIEEGLLQPQVRKSKSERTHKSRRVSESESGRSKHSRQSKHRHHSSRNDDSKSARSESSKTGKTKSKQKSVSGLKMLFSRRKVHAEAVAA